MHAQVYGTKSEGGARQTAGQNTGCEAARLVSGSPQLFYNMNVRWHPHQTTRSPRHPHFHYGGPAHTCSGPMQSDSGSSAANASRDRSATPHVTLPLWGALSGPKLKPEGRSPSGPETRCDGDGCTCKKQERLACKGAHARQGWRDA